MGLELVRSVLRLQPQPNHNSRVLEEFSIPKGVNEMKNSLISEIGVLIRRRD